ncbi:hypothetical protein [Fictibacillus enclensis]|nr:hypothetical protein [Fictibacillus enclensis]WHY72900.1 hypothetical protein QNH15_02890 [Fictibacillus enclensis]
MWLVILLVVIIGFAILLDWKRKRNNNHSHLPDAFRCETRGQLELHDG